MERRLRAIFYGAVFFVGVTINALWWLGPKEIDFWLNRYQTLLAAALAVIGVLVTVRTNVHISNRSRADIAEDNLDRFMIAIQAVHQEYWAIEAMNAAAIQNREAALTKLRNTISDSNAVAALTSALMGGDQGMIALFYNSSMQAAGDRCNGRVNERSENMVWPLYMELSNSIARRKAHLHNGGLVEDLRNMTLIDVQEAQRAYVDARAPIFY